MRYLILAALTVSVLLTGCGSNSPSPSNGSGREPTANGGDPNAGRSGMPPITRDDTPPEGDFRVILYQANGGQTMIMVNRGHTLRKSAEGRRRLALNIPNHGYKLLSETAMKALLQSLEERNLTRLSTPFQRGDERWFDSQAGDARYRGMIFVERNGNRSKVLGFRAAGINDGVGQARYKAFVELKLVFMNWFVSTTDTEVPGSGARDR